MKLYGYKNLRWVDKTTGQPLTDPTRPERRGQGHEGVRARRARGQHHRQLQQAVPARRHYGDGAARGRRRELHLAPHDRAARTASQNIKSLKLSLPAGAVGSLASAPQCQLADAARGQLPRPTKVGIDQQHGRLRKLDLTVAGSLYIGEALQPGDAASFIIEVPAKVGPIDLGNVIV